MIRTIKNIIEPAYVVILKICISLFYLLPIKKNRIVFIQSDGAGFRCNLKYIALEVIRQNLPYDMVWMVNNMHEEIPAPIRKVKYNRIKAVYNLATACVVINNLKSPFPVKKKTGQTFVYIPHGQPGAKCAEGDAIISEEYIAMSRQHSAMTDIFVSLGSYHTQVLKDTFWVPERAEILECGFPRNDQYYQEEADRVSAIRQKLGLAEHTRVLYYAPTFRDHGSIKGLDIDLDRALDVLERKTGAKWICFTTLHPAFMFFDKPIFKYGDRIVDMTSYPDLHELFLIVDVCITDYSSVSLDFCNTRRPVFLYAPDIEEYQKLRGLKPMFFNLPFDLCTNNEDLESAIKNFDEAVYAKKLEDFYFLYGSVDDGHASARFVERLKQLVG